MGYSRDTDDEYKRYSKPKENRLSEQQLNELEEELKNFYVEREVKIPEQKMVRILDKDAWFKSRGAMNAGGAIIVTNYSPSKYGSDGKLKTPKDCDPILFEQLEADLEQLNERTGRREYAEKKRLAELDGMVAEMDISSIDNHTQTEYGK